jgi:hypothetical protein
VVELVDAEDSKSSGSNTVRVRVSPSVPNIKFIEQFSSLYEISSLNGNGKERKFKNADPTKPIDTDYKTRKIFSLFK